MKEKEMGKHVKCCFKIHHPVQTISFVKLFFFEAMTILQIVLRGLGNLNFDPLNGWVLTFLIF